MTYYVFAGRFQPFHNGHYEVAKSVCSAMSDSDVLILAALVSLGGEGMPEDEWFVRVAEEHHAGERNPWGIVCRLEALEVVSAKLSLSGSRVVVTAIPRPDAYWRLVDSIFERPRVWVIPRADESFDEDKLAFFVSKGEEVLRIDDGSGISGRTLRSLVGRDFREFDRLVPRGTSGYYRAGDGDA